MTQPTVITSRDNPLLARLRKLARDPGAYRKLGCVWLEGEHLATAFASSSRPGGVAELAGAAGAAEVAVLADSAWNQPALRALAQCAPKVVCVTDALFDSFSALESPARIGLVMALPATPGIDPQAASVVLDRLQDAGNVGSILRSAAAFGVRQVLALQGTAALWSAKVLRAGMGAHFGLRLVEGLVIDDLQALAVPMVGTALSTDLLLGDVPLPQPCAWVLGHEGQGVAPALLARCAQVQRIPQPGGQESLNVAAAAAVCLYESARQALARGDQ